MKTGKPQPRQVGNALAPGVLTEKSLVWLLGLAAGLIFLVLAWPALNGQVYTYDDLTNSNLPMRYAYWSALHAGDSFLWSPQFYCGAYLHGESEVGMCHPLHLLLYKCLPLDLAFNIQFVGSYVMLFFGMFVFLRHLKLERPAALFGALAFAFSGFNLWHFMHLAPIAVVAHIPWLLLANDIVLCGTDRKQRVWAQLAVTLLTASQCLLGHPQFVFFSLLIEITFVLIRFRHWASWGRAPLLILAKVLGPVLGAVQLLPVWDMVSYTDRSDSSLRFRLSFSLHPWNLVQLWSPLALKERYFADWRWGNGNTHEMGLYTGAFCTVMVAWLALRWKKLGSQRGFILAVAGFGLVALVLALGKYGGLYPFISELPVMKQLAFRAPTRYILLLHFALSVLAAFALADLLQLARDRSRIALGALWPLAIPLGLSAVTFLAVVHFRGQPENVWNANLGSVGDAFAGLVLIFAAVAMVALAARGARWPVYGLVLLTFFEIAVWGLWQHLIQRGSPQSIETLVDRIGRPPSKEGRLAYLLPTSVFVIDGYKLMRGNIGLVPAKKLPFDVQSARLAGAHWAVVNNSWMGVPDPLPRVRLVSQAVVSTNPAPLIQQINLATTAVVDHSVDLVPGPAGKAELQTDRPGLIKIAVSAPTRQLLVLSESYHHGWKATVDGVAVPVFRTYGDYMGCVVEPGAKNIVFHFAPPSFFWGLRISLIGLGLVLLWFALELVFGSKLAPPQPAVAFTTQPAKEAAAPTPNKQK